MKQETDLAEKLFGNKRLETGSEKLTTTTIIGKALTDSENGYVEVEYDGNITYGDFQQNIVPTGPNVKAGDTVLITATGGVGKSMSVTNVQGWGDRLDKGVLEVSALIAEKADIEYLEAEYAHITEGVIDNAKIDYADVNHLEANYAHITDGVIDNAKIGYADVEELDANFAHITDGVIDNAKIGYADVEELDANFAHITDGVIDNAKIGYADVENLDANYAHITNGTIDNAKIGYADVNGLNANYAHITNGAIDNAKIGYADVNDLEANYAQIDFENVTNSWIENGVIRNGAIQNEMVQNVSASKLTAGTIDASKINVANLSADNLIVRRINGQPVVGGYTLIGTTSPGYSSKNPSQEGWYELSNGAFVLTQDTSVQEGKPYYQEGDEVALYDQAYIDSMKNQLNQRIDGAVETFTGTAVPTLTNYPYNTWYDTSLTPPKDERASHVGDIYFVTNPALDQDGYSYRFAYDNTSMSYMWVLIKDSDVTKALSDITDLQDFESETVSWQEETDEGLTTIRQNHTALSGVVDKTVKESVQLWFTKANTTAPSKPTAQVTSTSTDGNGWRTVVPSWNASYPNYYYCWQFKLADNTYAWSDVVRDIAMGESQGTSRSAQTTANANIKSSVQLWFTKANSTAPSKPTSQVTTNNAATGNAWNLAVPTYNASYPHYFYCYQQQKGDGTYQWSDVVYDKGTTEAMQKAQAALPSSTFTTFQSTTFKNLVDEVDEQSSTITSMSERIDKQVPIVSSSGERSITTEDAADLPLLTLEPVLGESVQNGNPTPSSPAYIMAVRPHNLITFNEFESGKIGDWQKNQNAVLTGHDGYLSIACGQTTSTPGAWCAVTLPAAGPYTVSLDARQRNSTTNSFRPTLFTTSGTKVLDFSSSAISPGQTWAHYSYTATVNVSGDMKFYIFTYGNSDTESGVEICNITLSYGSTDRGYAPYGHIGIISSTGDASYLDMQGYELHSLNSTYRDSIEIDASGHAILKKRTLKLYCSELSVTDYGTNPKADNTLGLGVNATGDTFNKIQLGGKTSGYPLPISTIAKGSTNGQSWAGGASNLNTVAGTTNAYPHNMYMCVSSTEYANAAAFQAALVGVLANEYVVTGLYEDYWEDVDLGYIDLPYVTDDAVVHVAAEISPVIGGSWWTKYGEETGRTVSNTVNSVKQTAESNTWSINGLTTTTQTLRNDLDNIDVGGRNLLLGTANFSKDCSLLSGAVVLSDTYEGCNVLSYNKTNTDATKDVVGWYGKITPKPSSYYTLSFWAKASTSLKIYSYFYPNTVESAVSSEGETSTAADGSMTTTLTTSWKRYWFTYKTRSDVSGVKNVLPVRVYAAHTGTIYVAGVKFENGNKATDWSPAPEDVQGSITTLESRSSKIEQTLDGFSSTVGAIVDETVVGTNILTGNALNPYNWTVSAPSSANYTKTAYGTAGVKVQFNTISGYEWLYSPAITVVSGKKYTLSVEYTVSKDYIITSGKGGYGLSVYKTTPPHSSFDNANANFIARAQFFETATRVAMKATVTFTASSNTIYLGLNGGQINDGQSGLTFTMDKLVLVENISSRMGSAETSITQNSSAISLNAKKTEQATNMLADFNAPTLAAVNGKAARYFSDNSSYRTGEVITISDPPEPWIVTGGRISTTGTTHTTNSQAKSGLVHYGYDGAYVTMTEGESYTFSFWARKVSGTCAWYCMVGSGPYLAKDESGSYQASNDLGTGWTYIEFPFTYTAAACGGNGLGCRVYPGIIFKAGTAGVGEVCGAKVTRGSYASQAELKVANDQIALRATKQQVLGNMSLYTPLEYLQSSGTQYINTGVIPTAYPIRVSVEVAYTSVPTSEKDFAGNLNTDVAAASAFVMGVNGSNGKWYHWGGKSGWNPAGSPAANVKYAVDMEFPDVNRRRVVIDGIEYSNYVNNYNSFTLGSNAIGLFSGGANRAYDAASVRIYSARIYNGGNLVRNLIPVKRISDSVLGMYDQENDVFYANVGTGSFTAGAESNWSKKIVSASAELSVQAGVISSKVANGNVISSINQSPETVKIAASKIEIDGTAVFNSISSKVDGAITAKGYATTSQAQGYASAAETNAKSYADSTVNNMSVGSRNLLIGSMDISTVDGEFGWTSNGNLAEQPKKVYLAGVGDCIYFKKNTTSDKYVPSIATRNIALVEWGKEYVYGIDIRFDKAITVAESVPNHYHAGSNSNGGYFNIGVSRSTDIASNNINISGGTVIPANTWVHYEHRFKWKAAPSDSSYPYAAFRPFVYGTVLNEAAGGVQGWMRNPYVIEANSFDKTTWSPAPEEQPKKNLSPFFSFEPYNTTAGQGGQYWQSFTYQNNIAPLGDGWARITTRDNTSGTGSVYDQHRPKAIPALNPGTTYTLLVEVKNVTKTGNVYLRCPDGGQTLNDASVIFVNGYNSTIDLPIVNGVFHKVFRTGPSTQTNYSTFFGLCTRIDASSKATYDARVSVYEGVYFGPYQPYDGMTIQQEQRIYYRSNSTTAPAAPTAFVTSTADANATWTTRRIKYDKDYSYMYTTMQRKRLDGTVSCDPVLLDDTTTVIDGGNIITNTISADKIKVSEINVGALGGSIGGTNLILYSNDQKLWGTYAPTGYSIANKVLLSENLVKGEKYTITIWGSQPTRSDKSSCWYAVYWGGGSISLVNVTIGSNGKGSMSFTAPNSSHADASNAWLSIYNTPSVGATGTTYGASITKMKLERGDRATDWSASPEDEIARRRAVYATCSTAAGTAAKVAACDKYQRYTGSMVTVTFSTANTATTPTLNVNSTGAATIKGYTGAALTAAEYKWAAGATIGFTYDGTYWRMQDGGALQAKADAASSASTATSKATAASNSATAAANSATAASGSASTASDKATAASNSATAAAGSASTASSKATAASNSATAAANSATAAASSATTASDKATAASNSATAAANSATEAANRDTAFFGTCGTAAGTQAKVVACTNFKSTNLKTGTTIVVRCSTAQTYVSAKITLNVNSTGAKDVYAGDAVTSATNQVLWAANAMVTFVYNGSQWVIESDPRNWFGACTTAAGTQAKAGTLNMAGAVVCKGTTVALQMSNANTHASPTLNVGSTAAKNLYIPGATTFPTVANGNSWFAGATVNFVFDGQYWRLQIPDSAKFATALTSNGVMVHKQADTTTGVQITDQVDIVKSGNSVATFAANKIELGKNSKTATIEMCKGSAVIEAVEAPISPKDTTKSAMSLSGEVMGINSDLYTWLSTGSPAANKYALTIGLENDGDAHGIVMNVTKYGANTSTISQRCLTSISANSFSIDTSFLAASTADKGKIYSGFDNDKLGIAPVPLYANESAAFSGSIPLAETAANFSRLELFCKDNDGRYCYTQVHNPNGKTVNVTQTLSYGGNFYVKSRAFKITGAAIDTASTSGTYHTGEVNAAGNNNGTSVDNIKIVKVLGYR